MTTQLRQQPERRCFSFQKGSIEECTKSIAILSEQVPQGGSAVAKEMATQLSPRTRAELIQLASAEVMTSRQQQVLEPAFSQLRLVALQQSIPFVGFGIMDNAILILAGDAIDTSLGVALGISTMCAAALGNIISDVAGVMLGTAVEDFSARYVAIPLPRLTPAQRRLRSVRFASQFGIAVGLVIGCFIGMFPLVFLNNSSSSQLQPSETQEEESDIGSKNHGISSGH